VAVTFGWACMTIGPPPYIGLGTPYNGLGPPYIGWNMTGSARGTGFRTKVKGLRRGKVEHAVQT